MLLIQLASCVESEGCDTQLKVMAVQTIKPYNWRTLQTHNIPSGFGKWVSSHEFSKETSPNKISQTIFWEDTSLSSPMENWMKTKKKSKNVEKIITSIFSQFLRIRSIFNKDDLLTITFSSGSMLFMNITSPHKIYTRNIKWPIEQKTENRLLNGVMNKQNKMRQLFAQSNGQVVELLDDRIAIKSTWEYFVEKE